MTDLRPALLLLDADAVTLAGAVGLAAWVAGATVAGAAGRS